MLRRHMLEWQRAVTLRPITLAAFTETAGWEIVAPQIGQIAGYGGERAEI